MIDEGNPDRDSSAPASRGRSTARLFFALWPDELLRAQLARWGDALYRECGGRQTRREALHITLVFLGDVAIERIDSVRSVAESVRAARFSLRLSRASYVPRKRIVWAAPEATPPALVGLVAHVSQALAALCMKIEDRPFSPHVTFLRDARLPGSALDCAPIAWTVEEFVLVRSRLRPEGSRYEVIGRWPLMIQQ